MINPFILVIQWLSLIVLIGLHIVVVVGLIFTLLDKYYADSGTKWGSVLLWTYILLFLDAAAWDYFHHGPFFFPQY